MTDFDLAAYTRAVREGGARGRCARARASSAPWSTATRPTATTSCLVAPRQHIEDWVHDLDERGHLALHAVVRRVARAVAVATERMYALSLGSAQGNAHLHWHVAPLPPGVPYQRQQFHALMAEHGVLPVDERERAALATQIRAHLAR